MQPHPPTGTAGMASLPREIIRWIQTLSLSKPLKHPKRDFANGYMVAEIASRFVAAVEMNLFDNVHSTQKKLANWRVLQKCLAKGGAPQIPEQLVQDVMNAKDGAGDELLTMMYSQFTSKPPPGTHPKGTGPGNMAPEPQALDHVPHFVRNIPGSSLDGGADGGGGGGGSPSGQSPTSGGEQAGRQLSAMAAEQLRAAELEMMKQKSESDLKNEILGLSDDEGKDNKRSQHHKSGGEGDAQAAELAARQAQKARLLRQPAVPQTTTQGQIRAVDLEAEKQEKAVLFNQVSVRQLSGAALQRFGFRDRSQSPSGRGGGASPGGSYQSARGGKGGAGGTGRGGIGAAIHHHLCHLFDRFVAEFFSSNTTWNPPADSSPLSYFIENCSNSNVISSSFKSNIWAFLHHEARRTAAVLATAPIDTLYFVAHFANVNIESPAPRPGDPQFTDLAKPKFFGTDAFDATLYCHVVLGALRELKISAAETILRRYAFPAILPVLFRNFDTTQQIPSLALTQQKAASLSVRRSLFALSALSLGNQQPRNTPSLSSCLKFCFISSNMDEESEAKIHNNTVSTHQFIEVIYDSILTNYETTVAYSSKIFSPELSQALSHQRVPTIARDVEFFNSLELICNSIRGEVPFDQMTPSDIEFPESLSLLIVHNIERGLAHESSSVQEASLRSLIALVQVGTCRLNSSSSSLSEVAQIVSKLVFQQLEGNLMPALREPRGIYSAPVASGSTLMELIKLLCVTMRGCGGGGGAIKQNSADQQEQLAMNNNNNGSEQQQQQQTSSSSSTSIRKRILQLAATCVSDLHHLALRDVERLALVSALASGLSNFDYTLPSTGNNNNNNNAVPSKITISNSTGTLEQTATYTEDRLAQTATQNNGAEEREHVQKIATFCVETLLALPPAVLEAFANSGGSITRALPSIIASTHDRTIFGSPLDFARWNSTAIGGCLASRFCSTFTTGPTSPVSPSATTFHYKIPTPSKTGSAGVLKLPVSPSPQSKPEDYNKFITPFKAVILLFTLFSAKVNTPDDQLSSYSNGRLASDICRSHRPDEDTVVWWTVLTNGFGHEMKKLLLYYDAARKGPASLAPRKDQEAEAVHEIFVQAGRAALYILGKLYQNISNAVPSPIQSNFGILFSGLGSRVSQPSSKISEDDKIVGQVGLEVASKAIEWLMTSVLPQQQQQQQSGRASVMSAGGGTLVSEPSMV